jgi:KaiC/GvpD/RAD55 family RecA-like ATPase
MGKLTARDVVWASICAQGRSTTFNQVKNTIPEDRRPSDETIRRVLRAATEAGVLEHAPNTHRYKHTDGRGLRATEPPGERIDL